MSRQCEATSAQATLRASQRVPLSECHYHNIAMDKKRPKSSDDKEDDPDTEVWEIVDADELSTQLNFHNSNRNFEHLNRGSMEAYSPRYS